MANVTLLAIITLFAVVGLFAKLLEVERRVTAIERDLHAATRIAEEALEE